MRSDSSLIIDLALSVIMIHILDSMPNSLKMDISMSARLEAVFFSLNSLHAEKTKGDQSGTLSNNKLKIQTYFQIPSLLGHLRDKVGCAGEKIVHGRLPNPPIASNGHSPCLIQQLLHLGHHLVTDLSNKSGQLPSGRDLDLQSKGKMLPY